MNATTIAATESRLHNTKAIEIGKTRYEVENVVATDKQVSVTLKKGNTLKTLIFSSNGWYLWSGRNGSTRSVGLPKQVQPRLIHVLEDERAFIA